MVTIPKLTYGRKYMKKNVFYICVILTVILIIARAGDIILYARDAMRLCCELIIPTLFPFFVCSGLLIRSGFGSLLAKAAKGIMRPLFNVAPAGAAAFVLGIISGFPLGALTAVQLYQCGSLSKSEAERLLAFCNNSGPLFIIGSIGTAIYSRPAYGVILYSIHIIASVAVGILFRGYNKNRHTAPPMRLNTLDMPLTEVFSEALTDASKNILTVCFSIIFFSTISRALLSLAPLPPILDALASGICEFSTGTLKTSLLDLDIYKKLIMTSFIVGFSGISVHIQVMAVTARSGLSLKPYIIGKLLHGAAAAGLTAAALNVLPVSAQVFSDNHHKMSSSFSVIPLMLLSAAVITLCLICICRRKYTTNDMLT